MILYYDCRCLQCGFKYQTIGVKENKTDGGSFCSSECLLDNLSRVGGEIGIKKLFGQESEGYSNVLIRLQEFYRDRSQTEYEFFLYRTRAVLSCKILKVLLSQENVILKSKILEKIPGNEKYLQDYFFTIGICKLSLGEEMSDEMKNWLNSRILGVLNTVKCEFKKPDKGAHQDKEIYMNIMKSTIDSLMNFHVEPSSQTPIDRKKRRPVNHIQFINCEDVKINKAHIKIKQSPFSQIKIDLLSLDMEFDDIIFEHIIREIENRYSFSLPNGFTLLEKSKHRDDNNKISINIRPICRFEKAKKLLQFPPNKEIILSRRIGSFNKKTEKRLTVHFYFGPEYFGNEMDFCFDISGPGDIPEAQNLISRYLVEHFSNEAALVTSESLITFDVSDQLKSLCSDINDLVMENRSDCHRIIQILVIPSHITLNWTLEEHLYRNQEIDIIKKHPRRGDLFTDIKNDISYLTCAKPKKINKMIDHISRSVPIFQILNAQLNFEEKLLLRMFRFRNLLKSSEVKINNLHPISFVFPPMNDSYSKILDWETSKVELLLKRKKKGKNDSISTFCSNTASESSPKDASVGKSRSFKDKLLTEEFKIRPDLREFIKKLVQEVSDHSDENLEYGDDSSCLINYFPTILVLVFDSVKHTPNETLLLFILLSESIQMSSHSSYQLTKVVSTEYNPNTKLAKCSIIEPADVIYWQAKMRNEVVGGSVERTIQIVFELRTKSILG